MAPAQIGGWTHVVCPLPQQFARRGGVRVQDDRGLGTPLGLSLIPYTPRQQLPHPQAPVEV